MSSKTPKPRKDSFFSLHFTSTISISMVLFMIGLITLVILSARDFSTETRENISVSVILDDGINDDDLTRLQNYIKAAGFTKDYKYISKADALAEYTEAMGGDPTELLGYNPLYASIEIYLKSEFAHNDSITKLVEPKVSAFSGIKEITYQQDMLRMFNQNIQRFTIILGSLTILLLIISIALINNTIRLSIYSKRFIIKTMQLVGAKSNFIRRPFIRRYLFNGLISALLAIIFLALVANRIQSELGTNFDIYQTNIILPVISIIIGFSILITYFATLFSVNRYLRMKTDKLYYI